MVLVVKWISGLVGYWVGSGRICRCCLGLCKQGRSGTGCRDGREDPDEMRDVEGVEKEIN